MLKFFSSSKPGGFAAYVYLDLGDGRYLVVDDEDTEHGSELYKILNKDQVHLTTELGSKYCEEILQDLIKILIQGRKDSETLDRLREDVKRLLS